MPEVKLTLYTHARDAEAIADNLRAHLRTAVHVRAETVYGRDFDDARTAERVTGALDHAALEVILDPAALTGALRVAQDTRRSSGVRWIVTEMLDSGRFA